jgi:hypothetical protein
MDVDMDQPTHLNQRVFRCGISFCYESKLLTYVLAGCGRGLDVR